LSNQEQEFNLIKDEMVQANSKFKKTFQEAEDVFKKKQDENK